MARRSTTPARAAVLIFFEWTLLLIALAAFTVTETYQAYVTLGLVLLVVTFILRVVRTGNLLPRSGLEIPWALGILSGAAAAWIAYDHPVAWLQFARLLAAFVLYYAVIALRETDLRWLALGFVTAAAGLALYWPLQNDFSAQPGKLALITKLGTFLNRSLPSLPGPEIHPNVAAGTLAVAVPLGIALVWYAWRSRQKLLSGLAGLLTLLILGGLFMTSSRGAWLALAGSGLLAGLAWAQRRWFSRPAQQAGFWAAVLLVAIAVGGAVFLTGSFDRLLGQLPDPGGGIQARSRLWQQGWQMVEDYPFSGSGLMSFWNVHAIYILQMHVPFIAHAHNTFLEVWIEQGVVGFLGLILAGLVTAIWAWQALGRKSVSPWGWAGLAALTVASLHGMVDVVFYVTRTLPLIGLLFGFAWFLNVNQDGTRVAWRPVIKTRLAWGILGGLLLAVLLAAVLLRGRLSGAWYANLGALQQTSQELAIYDPQQFDQLTLDQVRQSIDQQPALDNYARSLAYDPSNRTALQRRGQIALSRGEYQAALEDLARLWQTGERADATRLLYGDALAAEGQVEEAAQVVRGVSWAAERLAGQAWARYWLNQDYRRAANAWSVALLLNPQAPAIQEMLEQARTKIK